MLLTFSSYVLLRKSCQSLRRKSALQLATTASHYHCMLFCCRTDIFWNMHGRTVFGSEVVDLSLIVFYLRSYICQGSTLLPMLHIFLPAISAATFRIAIPGTSFWSFSKSFFPFLYEYWWRLRNYFYPLSGARQFLCLVDAGFLSVSQSALIDYSKLELRTGSWSWPQWKKLPLRLFRPVDVWH